jgi:hypothetical protein
MCCLQHMEEYNSTFCSLLEKTAQADVLLMNRLDYVYVIRVRTYLSLIVRLFNVFLFVHLRHIISMKLVLHVNKHGVFIVQNVTIYHV